MELIARQAVAGGVDAVQVREPDLEPAQLESLVRTILEAAGDATVLINSNPAVASGLGIGLHLPERADLAGARALLGSNTLIGRSVHSAAAARESDVADFLVAGHVFQTPSHADRPPLGLGGLRAIVAATPRPVIAIGGINERNAADIVAAGAYGVAVISAINQAEDPCHSAASIRSAIEEGLEARMDQPSITVQLNGRDTELPGGATVQRFLELRGLTGRLVVVELNGRIVSRADFGETQLAEGDRLEVVHFVGGG
jgi:thiamine biosynthesis protein ThiS